MKRVARIQFDRPLEVSGGFRPAPLPAVDVAGQGEDLRAVWQGEAGVLQLDRAPIVIAVAVIEMSRQGETRRRRRPGPGAKQS